jgi:mono/diheme cytochrome c family protein
MTIRKRFIGACLISATLCGCSASKDYKPAEGMSAEQIFAEACSGCHGDEGEGKFGFLLSIAGTQTAGEELTTLIRNGGHLMPAFTQIDKETAEALVAYLKSR